MTTDGRMFWKMTVASGFWMSMLPAVVKGVVLVMT